MNTFKKILVVVLSSCVLGVLTHSCDKNNDYPALLVTADSLIMRGNYDLADSVLILYDQEKHTQKESNNRYRQLLALERLFVSDKLLESDFSVADSLCRYFYDKDKKSEYSRSLCMLGEIYRLSGDYPSALDAFLNADILSKEYGESYVQCWSYQKRGDLFFDQKMYDECSDCYQKYYTTASQNRDTLRMALAAFRMGQVYTIKSDVDSTIYYYTQSMNLGKHTRYPENIIPYSRNALCDIYIQIEDYDEALKYLSRDSTDDANWAYWYMGQGMVDSAIVYFEKIKNRYSLYGQSESFHNLALLEEIKGNKQKALYYYKQQIDLNDSLSSLSLVEATRKVNAQFNLNQIKKERDSISQHSAFVEKLLYIILSFFGLLVVSAYYGWNYHRQKQKRKQTQQM